MSKQTSKGGAFNAMPARRSSEDTHSDFFDVIAANPGTFLDPTAQLANGP